MIASETSFACTIKSQNHGHADLYSAMRRTVHPSPSTLRPGGVRAAALAKPKIAAEIRAFWFYDLRAKAADDMAQTRGEAAASAQLEHTSVRTTKRRYLRQGTKLQATK